MFKKLWQGLSKTREKLTSGLKDLFELFDERVIELATAGEEALQAGGELLAGLGEALPELLEHGGPVALR
ncbi:MAG: hypothetical protein RL885_00290, partial [Planctomycetota bacterium]